MKLFALDKHLNTYMVGVVIEHNLNLAKDGETCGVGDRCIEIYLRI